MREKFQRFMNKFDKAIVLSLASIVFIVCLVALAIGTLNQCRKAKSSIVEYFETKTLQEQTDHLEKTKRILSVTEADIFGISDFVFNISSQEDLELADKKEFLFVLRGLEENAAKLEDEFDAYFNDLSVQYSPFSDEVITSFIYESRNFSLALKRFVRQSEFVLLGSDEPTVDQGELLAEQYYEVVWYVEQLTGSDQALQSEMGQNNQ